ncbi:hypothetical protein HMPREF0239_02211 [Clostridium sp. ATCC BAA-442]|nr:hypothetical protein HMPREF0239_02211 [Clostridium sp. ATCC BAA-442]
MLGSKCRRGYTSFPQKGPAGAGRVALSCGHGIRGLPFYFG